MYTSIQMGKIGLHTHSLWNLLNSTATCILIRVKVLINYIFAFNYWPPVITAVWLQKVHAVSDDRVL